MRVHQRPLVVLFGFLGAKMRYVRSYAKFIKGLQINTASLPSKTKQMTSCDVYLHQPEVMNLFQPEEATEMALQVGDDISRALEPTLVMRASPGESEADLSAFLASFAPRPSASASVPPPPAPSLLTPLPVAPRPIIFYLLSNNGAFSYAHLMTTLARRDPASYAKIAGSTQGIVFDSCPSLPNIELFTRGFTSVTSGSVFGMKPPVTNHIFLSPLVRALMRRATDSRKGAEMLTSIEDGLRHHVPARASLLYMTSEADNLVFKDEVVQLANMQAKKVDVLDAHEPQTERSFSEHLNHQLHQQLQRPVTSSFSTLPLELLPRPPRDLTGLSREAQLALAACSLHPSARVWVEDFGNSPHVDHLRTCPERYHALVSAFFEHALRAPFDCEVPSLPTAYHAPASAGGARLASGKA